MQMLTTTTTHKTLRGPRGGMILFQQGMQKRIQLQQGCIPGNPGRSADACHRWQRLSASRRHLSQSFKEYQQEIIDNAQALAKGLQSRGLKIVSGGTDNHLMLVDLPDKRLTGKAVEKLS